MRHVHRHRNSSAPPTRCNSHPKQQARPPQQKHLCSRNSRPLTTGGGGGDPLGWGTILPPQLTVGRRSPSDRTIHPVPPSPHSAALAPLCSSFLQPLCFMGGRGKGGAQRQSPYVQSAQSKCLFVHKVHTSHRCTVTVDGALPKAETCLTEPSTSGAGRTSSLGGS